MTLTPQTAQTIKDIIRHHRAWVDAIMGKNDQEAAAALVGMKRALATFKNGCPYCGHHMTTLHNCNLGRSLTRTLRNCSNCKTTVTTDTPHGR